MKNKKIIVALVILFIIILAVLLIIISRKSPAELKAEKYFKERGKRQIEALKGLSEIATDIAGNARIDFYGRVIDEDGKPLPNVKVTLEIKSTDTSPAGVLNMIRIAEQSYTKKEKIVHTDVNGEFRIENESGVALSIDENKIEKAGYVYAAGCTKYLTFCKGDEDRCYIPDKSKPEIYRLWREDKTEELIKNEMGDGYKANGNAINLFTRNYSDKENEGDIKVKITCPENIIFGDKYYDWSCSIEAINGGLVETNDEQFYLAPGNGYVPSYSYQIKAEDKDNWKYELKKKYYFKSRNGKVYGAIVLTFKTGCLGYDSKIKKRYTFSSVYIDEYILNPCGSRILVYNYDKRITDPHEFYKENFSEEYKALKEKEEQRLKAIREQGEQEKEEDNVSP